MFDVFDIGLFAAMNDVPDVDCDISLTNLVGAVLIAIGVVTLVAARPLDANDEPETVPAGEQFPAPRDPAVLPIRLDASGSHSISPTVAVAPTLSRGGRDV